ncbi:MAG: LysE family transporter [Planctomycetes bacterium]|nr:LysE family transporter [Planctomycetota bacterium]
MDIILQYGGGVAIGLVAAISPGPDTVLVLRSVAAGGARAGAKAAFGIGAALFLHAFATVLLVLLLRDIVGSIALTIVQMTGAAYLGYLGILLLRSAMTRGADTADPDAGATPIQGFFTQGFITNLTNPKAIVFFGSIVSQFMTAQDVGPGGALLLGIVTAVPAWFILLSYVSAQALRDLTDRTRRTIDVIAGVLFLGLACWGVASVWLR